MKRALLSLAVVAAAASFVPAASAGPCGPEPAGCPACPYVLVLDEGVKNIRLEHAQC